MTFAYIPLSKWCMEEDEYSAELLHLSVSGAAGGGLEKHVNAKAQQGRLSFQFSFFCTN